MGRFRCPDARANRILIIGIIVMIVILSNEVYDAVDVDPGEGLDEVSFLLVNAHKYLTLIVGVVTIVVSLCSRREKKSGGSETSWWRW